MTAFSPLVLDARNPGPMTGAGNNTYLITTTAGAVLIDAGVGDSRHLADLQMALDAARTELTDVVVTHGHGDHAGGALALAAAFPNAVFAKSPWPTHDDRYGVRWRHLHDNDRISRGDVELVALHTPGHSPDHLTLWHAPSRTAFTGDLVVPGSSVMIDWSGGGNLRDYMRSLERILSLDPLVLLPGHGARVDNPRAVLIGYLNHRLEREQQILRALRAGHASVEAIAETVYHDIAPALMPAARENVRAHLEKLQAEAVACADPSGRWSLLR